MLSPVRLHTQYHSFEYNNIIIKDQYLKPNCISAIYLMTLDTLFVSFTDILYPNLENDYAFVLDVTYWMW